MKNINNDIFKNFKHSKMKPQNPESPKAPAIEPNERNKLMVVVCDTSHASYTASDVRDNQNGVLTYVMSGKQNEAKI